MVFFGSLEFLEQQIKKTCGQPGTSKEYNIVEDRVSRWKRKFQAITRYLIRQQVIKVNNSM